MKTIIFALFLLISCDYKCEYKTVCMDTDGNLTSDDGEGDRDDMPYYTSSYISLKSACETLDGNFTSGLCD